MKRLALLILFAGLLNGCPAPPIDKVDGYLPPGQTSVPVGTVAVDRLLRYSGKLVQGELAVQADENGNTILASGEDGTDGVSIYLAEAARQELLAHLFRTRKLGSELGEGAAATEKHVGTIVSSPSPDVVNAVRIDYAFRAYGQSWICLLELSGYDRVSILTSHIGRPEGRRDLRLVLKPEAVDRLLKLVEQAPLSSPGHQ